jgi:hypothetical protein
LAGTAQTAKDVPTADNQAYFNAGLVQFFYVLRGCFEGFGGDTEASICPTQGLAAELDEYAFVVEFWRQALHEAIVYSARP